MRLIRLPGYVTYTKYLGNCSAELCASMLEEPEAYIYISIIERLIKWINKVTHIHHCKTCVKI